MAPVKAIRVQTLIEEKTGKVFNIENPLLKPDSLFPDIGVNGRKTKSVWLSLTTNNQNMVTPVTHRGG